MLSAKSVVTTLMVLCWGGTLGWANLSQKAIAQETASSTSPEKVTTPTPKKPNVTDQAATTKPLANRLVLKLRERRVYAYQGDKLLASFPVAIGKKGWETPKGSFQILQMVRNPIWQNPWNNKIVPAGPRNPLGERWIGFWTDGKNTIGFHGTQGEHLIGRAVSHGCVRMRNKDIKKLFELVQLGTPVIVQK
jgi:lipoprotein-anchoring transpeptidase ErfK/SrfK